MQNYLHRCLNSLLVSPDLMDMLEVIVINDGSKDESSAIAHEYEERFTHVFRVIDKENGNYGSCINVGLSEAQGRYVKILDADDWFDTAIFEDYIERLSQMDGVDMVITDFSTMSEESDSGQKNTFPIAYDKEFSFQDYIGLEYFAHHAVTYRVGLLHDIQYRQTEGISYTDTEWVMYPQLYVDKCVYLNMDLYRYLLGREGQTMDPAVRRKSCSQLIIILKRMIQTINSFSKNDLNKGGFLRIKSYVLHESKGLYNTFLVKSSKEDFCSEQLVDFDSFLFRNQPEMYFSIGEALVLKGIPIHYVKYWRKHGERFPVDVLRSWYRKIRYGHSK